MMKTCKKVKRCELVKTKMKASRRWEYFSQKYIFISLPETYRNESF